MSKLHRGRRKLIVTALTIALLGLVVLLSGVRGADRGPRTLWVKLVFGADSKTAVWTGSLSVEHGKALSLAEWGLEAADRLDADTFSWKIRSLRLEPGQARPEFADSGSFAESMRGILVKVEVTPKTVVRVKTSQGQFAFKPLDLAPGRPVKELAGRVTIEPLGEEDLVASTRTEDDHPAIAVDSDGHRHVAWIAYDDGGKKEHLLVRDVDDPSARAQPIAAGPEFDSVRLVSSPSGILRAIWCSPARSGNWDVYTATRTKRGWSAPQRLTTATGTDFQLAASQGPGGRLWLVWQSFRNGNADIYARCLQGDTWSDDIAVAITSANEWQPSVSVDDKQPVRKRLERTTPRE